MSRLGVLGASALLACFYGLCAHAAEADAEPAEPEEGLGRGATEPPKKEADGDRLPLRDDDDEEDAGCKPPDEEIAIIVSNTPFLGRILPPLTETNFSFKLSATGDVVTLRWTALDEEERTRVQRLCRMEVDDSGVKKFGRKVQGLRLHLTNGRTIVGMPIPERAVPGFWAIRTATMPLLLIPKGDVKKEQKFFERESFFYPAQELYERLLLERPPRDDAADDHLEFAKQSAAMGLYLKALGHLDVAEAIEPKLKDTMLEFRTQVAEQHAEQQAEKLYNQMMLAMRGGNYAEALDLADRILRSFQSTTHRGKAERWIPTLKKQADESLKKRVSYMFYAYFDDFIQRKLFERVRVDKDGRVIPPKPGKAVYLKSGQVFRGEPLALEGEEISLKGERATIKIPSRDVMDIRDIDLNTEGKLTHPPFSLLHAYVTDKKGGLGQDIAGMISKRLNIPEEKVWEIWEKRRETEICVVDGVPKKSWQYTKICTAYYGAGSWLRESVGGGATGRGTGSTGRASPRTAEEGSPGEAANRPTGTGRATGNTGGPTPRNAAGAANQKKFFMDDPWTSDDPEIFWKVNNLESKYNILKGFAAETFCKVLSVYGRRCATCGGLGCIRLMTGLSSESRVTCPTCRGKGYFRCIQYE